MSSDISVLLPVHAQIVPEHLARALESIHAQTLQPAEVVLVEDGPLPAALRRVIASWSAGDIPVVRVVLPENKGPGVANMAGLVRARFTWIAKADADDVNVADRFERQMNAIEEHRLDVVGSALAEFEGAEANVVGIRPSPLTQELIERRLRWNNPLNHPTILFRRRLALECGGYPELRFMEDYDLAARMVIAGARIRNLPEPLVLFRADSMHQRRTDRRATACEWRLQRNLRAYGINGPMRMWVNLVIRLGYRRLPSAVLERVYRALFRQASP